VVGFIPTHGSTKDKKPVVARSVVASRSESPISSHPHRLPTLAVAKELPSADLPGIYQALQATRHLLEMYRRQLGNEKTRRRLQRLGKRLFTVASQLHRIQTEQK